MIVGGSCVKSSSFSLMTPYSSSIAKTKLLGVASQKRRSCFRFFLDDHHSVRVIPAKFHIHRSWFVQPDIRHSRLYASFRRNTPFGLFREFSRIYGTRICIQSSPLPIASCFGHTQKSGNFPGERISNGNITILPLRARMHV